MACFLQKLRSKYKITIFKFKLMEILLEQTSIKNNLQKVGIEIAKGKVKVEYFEEELSLFGFIPYNVYKNNLHFSIGINLNAAIIVTPYLVRFNNRSYPVPLFKKIEFTKGQKFKLNNEILIDTRLEDIPDRNLGEILDGSPLHPSPIPGDDFERYIKKAWPKKRLYFERNDDGSCNYICQDGELLLSQSALNASCISNDFVCLCCYENKVTGLLSYIVLPSNDVIRKETINISNP